MLSRPWGPITILGAFISGMAGLPRIVTLHDFEITLDADAAPMLEMSILAKTYRYREEDDEALGEGARAMG